MIGYAIPGLYYHYKLNSALIRELYAGGYNQDTGIKIDAVFGLFPFCIWDGGRIFNKYNHCTAEEIEAICNTYNNLGIPVRLVLSNTQLKEEHYYDHYGNTILKICHNDLNQVVCSDDNFREYIHSNYPSYKFISSTTKCLNVEDFKKELAKPEYFETCLDFNLNKNKKLLESLSSEEKDKCEFLVNALCVPGCPTRKDHYRLNSLYYMNFGKPYTVPKCGVGYSILDPRFKSVNNLDLKMIQEYANNGFSHFKLEGRTLLSFEVLGMYNNYGIIPKDQMSFYNFVIAQKAGVKIEPGIKE